MNQFEHPGSLKTACKLACRHLHHNQPEWEQLESSTRQTEQHRPTVAAGYRLFDAGIGQTDLLIPTLFPSLPSLVTNDWLQQIIPRLSRMPIAQDLSEANAQQGFIVVRLHHLVQHQQQRVTDRCLFRNPSHPPCSVSGIRKRLNQPNESIRTFGFTQSCLQASLQASTPQPTRMGATREQNKTNRATQTHSGSRGYRL
jgi:hypothetical protein